MTDTISQQVIAGLKIHYERTGRTFPTDEDALLFILTEVAEASECILRAPEKPYLRNHDRLEYDPSRYEEELADVIHMAIVAGIVRDLDPLGLILKKYRLGNEA